MHNNYYYFQHLVPALFTKLSSATLTSCFSQNKDELILEFNTTANTYFYIKASLKNQFSCLSFPLKFHRAKRNSVSIFEEIIGKKLISIESILNERAFILNFDQNKGLLFKLYGNQSNILYLVNQKVEALFKNTLKKDATLDVTNLHRTLNISFSALKLANWNIRKVIPTLDKKSSEILLNRLHFAQDKEAEFNSFMKELNNKNFYIDAEKNGYRLNLIKTENTKFSFTDPLEAISVFFEKEVRLKSVNGIKSKLIASINGQLIKSDNYVKKLTKKLNELSSGSSNQQKADLIMANLHAINKGSNSIKLFNFYNNNNDIIIKLSPLHSPQKNAERYYRKAKNEAKEINVLTQNIRLKNETIRTLKQKLETINKSDDFKFLQSLMPKQVASENDVPLAYKEFTIDGFTILVGKNAKHNDALTLKIAKKDDLWLHAKDVSGSHVVIKQIPGKNYPEYIIEKAAQLAAYHSKRKTDSLCPVLYTPKKYVRKKKGTPVGAMFIEKEKVILVEPNSSIH